MTTLAEIRDAVAQQIQVAVGDKTNVVPYAVGQGETSPPLPRISLRLDADTKYKETLDAAGGPSVVLLVDLVVSASSAANVSAIMNAYLDPWGDSSIYGALTSDQTFGGIVTASSVLGLQEVDELAGTATLPLTIWAD